MKTILGLDLGTNSIGWALIEKNNVANEGKILGIGTRIIPMSQDVLGKFDSGVSISQTAERTNFRGIRRLRERHLLRRERLHRVLNILKFLPNHYSAQIDFNNHPGKFIPETEPKIVYAINAESGKAEFVFKTSFEEMLEDFSKHQPQLLVNKKKVPYDWTIYYLRKKALTQRIEKEELAWLLLNFNQKRGYYQLRGEEEEETPNKKVEFYSLLVTDVVDSGDKKGNDVWYNVHLENGWIYRRTSKTLLDWTGKTKEFIVTTELNEGGSIKTDKEGKERRSFKAVDSHKDWIAIKKSTEDKIGKSHKTVGEYIYDTLLQQPVQKIKGKLVRVIERKFYKDELKKILNKQKEFHNELNSKELFTQCLEELYQFNEPHKSSLRNKDSFVHLFIDDIIFYQRPLKSKKSLITNCKFEKRIFKNAEGKFQSVSLKGIAKSHPLFQEFRLWQFIQNLKIYKREQPDDIDVTEQYLATEEQKVKLFDWLNERKEIKHEPLLKEVLQIKKSDTYRWNYADDIEKSYPANETKSLILKRLKDADVPDNFLSREKEEKLWHILYSVEDKNDVLKALKTFADKNNLGERFIEQFKKFPRFKKEYGAYSEKAIKKLLPLMRMGKYWKEDYIIDNIPSYQNNIHNLLTALEEKNKNITEENKLKGKSINVNFLDTLQSFSNGNIDAYKGLEHHIASYLVYGKHSEDTDVLQWKTPDDIQNYLNEFKQHSLRNPIVEQVITETLRVVEDIWKYYGNSKENYFDEIHLELGREMKNPANKRKELTDKINKNENTNLRIKALLTELFNEGDKNVRPYSPMQQEILKIYEEGVLTAVNGNAPDDIIKISKQAIPTSADLKRYKLWLDQGYHSPYTGKAIPLSKLFTREYDIEHIIPQSRFFDDSLSNKVICETEINNDKGNRTAYEYIKQESGAKKTLSHGKDINLLKLEDYEDFIKRSFSGNRTKLKKLLMEEPPENFINRQLNDSRYISKIVKNLLSNIVREDNEQEAISKNVVPVTGSITSQMKEDWGLHHIWNEIITPRFIRLNEVMQSNVFGEINSNTNKFLPRVPLEHEKGFNRKRIDHRHHALDALTIACITKEHVNYISSLNSKSVNYSLKPKLRRTENVIVNGNTINVAKEFYKPWETFTQDARENLQNTIISFKQNLRIINKTTNYYQAWTKNENGQLNKKLVKQTKGESIATRKPIHKDTIAGLVKLKFRKFVSLNVALDNWEMITNKLLRLKIKELINEGYDKKKLLKYFKEASDVWNNDISKVEVFYFDVNKKGLPNNAATRVNLDETFNTLMINCITDTGIQKILFNHLYNYNEEKNGKIIEHPELAFSPDGIDVLNKNIVELNKGKHHQPIYKVRTYEPRGNKFNIGEKGNKKAKYVETAKGTNLFFAVYFNKNGKRNYETIPLNVIIERKRQKLYPVPEINEAGDALLFYLSPNDLVYVPKAEDKENLKSLDLINLNKEQKQRIYKVVSFTNNRLYCIPYYVAKSIVDKVEFTQLNKLEFSLDKQLIKNVCMKLQTDRLGNLIH